MIFYDKIKDFKDTLLSKNKQILSDYLVEKLSSFYHRLVILSMLLIASIIVISLLFFNWLNLQIPNLFIEGTIFLYTVLVLIVLIFPFTYLVAYLKSNTERQNIKENIKNINSFKEISLLAKNFFSNFNPYIYVGLIFKEEYMSIENKLPILNKLIYLSAEDLKELKRILTEDEFNIVINELPKFYNPEDKSFNIEVIDTILAMLSDLEKKQIEKDEMFSILGSAINE